MNLGWFLLKIVRGVMSMTIKLEDFDIDNISIDGKSHENILIYDVSYKTLIGSKPSHNRFNKIERFIRIYDGTRYLTLFAAEKYDAIYHRIRYPISLKRRITYIFSHNIANIQIDSYCSLPVEKKLTLYNVIILIKSVKITKDKITTTIFLGKCSYQLVKK